MDFQTVSIEEEIDTSVHSLPVTDRALALRLVILICLQRKDYVAVSHVIEKTKLHPGALFTGQFDRGVVTNKDLVKRLGICYKLYKAAFKEKHKRLPRLIQDEGCLPQVVIHAPTNSSTGNHIWFKIKKIPCYKEQMQEYLKLAVAFNNSILEEAGFGPYTLEESTNREKMSKVWEQAVRTKKTKGRIPAVVLAGGY